MSFSGLLRTPVPTAEVAAKEASSSEPTDARLLLPAPAEPVRVRRVDVTGQLRGGGGIASSGSTGTTRDFSPATG
jgi:hypothetical protein